MSHDPITILAKVNPFRDEDPLASEVISARVAAIVAAPTPSETPAGSGQRRRTTALILAAGISAVALAAAAFTFIHREHAANPAGVLCLAAASLDGNRAVVESSRNPVEACAAAWRDGTFGTDGPPLMSACVNSAGVPTVVPGGPEICSQLGLPEYSPDRSPDEQAVFDLQTQLTNRFVDKCLSQDASLRAARAALADAGVDGWTVQLAGPFPAHNYCGAAALVRGDKRVVIGSRPPN